MSSFAPDYKTIGENLTRFINDPNFYECRSPVEICKILGFAKLSPEDFNTVFLNLKFKYKDQNNIIMMLQQADVEVGKKPNQIQLVLHTISKMLDIPALKAASDSISNIVGQPKNISNENQRQNTNSTDSSSQKTIDDLNKAIKKLEQSIFKKDSEIESLKEANELNQSKETEIIGLQNLLTKAVNDTKQLQELVTAKDQEIKTVKARVTRRDRENKRLSDELVACRNRLQDMEIQNHELHTAMEREIAQIRQLLDQKEQESRVLKERAENSEKELKNFVTKAARRDRENRNLTQQLRAKDDEIKNLNDEIQNLRNEILQKETEIDTLSVIDNDEGLKQELQDKEMAMQMMSSEFQQQAALLKQKSHQYRKAAYAYKKKVTELQAKLDENQKNSNLENELKEENSNLKKLVKRLQSELKKHVRPPPMPMIEPIEEHLPQERIVLAPDSDTPQTLDPSEAMKRRRLRRKPKDTPKKE